MELNLTIQLDNSTFRHDDGTLNFSQVAKILCNIAEEVDWENSNFLIKDDNDNYVGRLQITSPEDKL